MSHTLQNLSNNHSVQCASVYMFLNAENKDCVILCSFCKEGFSEWPKFYRHLQENHLLKMPCQGDSKIANGEEDIYIKTEYLDEEFQLDSNYLLEECNIKTEYLEDEETLFITKFSEKFTELTKNREDATGSEGCFVKTVKPINNCFFRLCTTDSSVMLNFIELLRDQPCQWDYKHNFYNKEQRVASTSNLTKQLNKLFKLNITPQVTRNSVLILIRWFENEYIRLLNCQQNNYEFVCTHKEYFEKLLGFLPHEHLRPMNCDQCFKRFKSEHLLLAHKHKHHNGQVPFRCRFCGHGFIHQSSHKMHENRHIKLYVWPCSKCPYQAVSKSDHIKHLATHFPQQPHKCSICGLAYKTKTNLNVHVKSHNLPAYKCEICHKRFYEKYRYKRHIWSHEKNELSQKSMDNFTCEICGKRFTTCNNLLRHQWVHVQENCEVDNQPEENSRKLNVYFCNHCSLEFISKETYEAHMTLKHNFKFEDCYFNTAQ